MYIRLLGPVQAGADRQPLSVAAKPRAVLAMLALDAGRTVSVDRLIEGLWGDEPPLTAVKLVQLYVSQLRKAIGSNGAGAEIITNGRGYELRLEPDAVDAARFERLLTAGEPRAALALWRGPPLGDLAEEPFATAEIRRLEELRLAAIEQAIDDDLAAGRHREVVAELQALVADEPLRERLHAQRMLALYRSGRQADALAAYRDARALLVDRIGVEPGPELRRLHDAILRQDPALDLPAPEPAEPRGELARWRRAGEQAGRRLGDSVERAAGGRAAWRAAEEDLADNVVELQAARERVALLDGGVVECPFKGLASFDVDDAAVYFGRERLIADMVARLAGAPLLGVVGPSGSGKSSALKAGLLAMLAAGALPGSAGWGQVLLRPGPRPVRTFEDAMVAAPHGRLVVAVDQFEELFTACSDEAERSAFADALVGAVRDRQRRALVLVAVRADFYGYCAAYPELARLIGANHVLVGPMRRDELRRAIELPARHAGLTVERDLVDALIADVQGRPGALPVLSTALLELWRQRDDGRLRLVGYGRAGGVDGAVARLAERAYDRLDGGRRELARRILLRLAGESDDGGIVARRVPLSEFAEEERAVVDALADERLLTIGAGDAEVAHEALLREWPRLRGWLAEDAEGRRVQRHLRAAARDWEAGGRDVGELYRGARLAAALDWSSAHSADLDATERAFVEQSRAAGERSRRRLQATLAGVAALLVLAVIAGAVALEQRASAREQALAADAQRLGARALAEDDLDRALLLARQGVALDDSAQTRGNLLATLLRSPSAIGILRADDEPVTVVALSPDERVLAAGTNTNKVFLFDTRTRRRLATLEVDAGAFGNTLAFSPDGRSLAVGYDLGGAAVAVFKLGRLDFARYSPPRTDGVLSGLRYSPDGRELQLVISRALGLGTPGPALFMRLDASTGAPLSLPVRINRSGSTSLMLTRDERRLVAVGENETFVRDAESMRVLKRWPVGGRGASGFWPSALSPDGRTVAVGGEDGSVRFLDLQTGESRTGLGRHVAEVFGARFTPDSRRLVTTGADSSAILWDVRDAAAGETLSGQAGRVLTPEITRDGSTLYTAGPGAAVFVWDLVGDQGLGRLFSTGARTAQPGFAAVVPGQAFLALSSDGRLMARGQDDGAVSIVDGQTLVRRRQFPVVTTGPVHGLGFVPRSRLLVVSGPDGFLALADADRGRVLQHVPGHRGNVLPPAIGADGRLLATAGEDRTVRLWSLPDMGPLSAPLRFDRDLEDVQVSPDGRRLVIVVGGKLEVWDTRGRSLVTRLRVPDAPHAVRFSPDGRLLAVGYANGRSQVWSTGTWRPVTRLLAGDVGDIYAMAISRDGRTLATGSNDRTLRLWDIETQQAIGPPLPGPGRGVGAVAPYFTPDGAALIASYDTGRAYRWDIRPESLARHACRVAGRRLTRAEWDAFLPGRDYDPAC